MSPVTSFVAPKKMLSTFLVKRPDEHLEYPQWITFLNLSNGRKRLNSMKSWMSPSQHQEVQQSWRKLQLKPLVPAAMTAVNATKFVNPEVIMATWAKVLWCCQLLQLKQVTLWTQQQWLVPWQIGWAPWFYQEKTLSSWLTYQVVKILGNLKRRKFGTSVWEEMHHHWLWYLMETYRGVIC